MADLKYLLNYLSEILATYVPLSNFQVAGNTETNSMLYNTYTQKFSYICGQYVAYGLKGVGYHLNAIYSTRRPLLEHRVIILETH